MILLNQPWREFEQMRRRQRICRLLAILCFCAAMVLLGFGLGQLIEIHK